MYGIPLVFDLGYDAKLTPFEQRNTAKQLVLCYGANRDHVDPFHLNFLNCNRDSVLFKWLEKSVPTITQPESPVNVDQRCYLDLFDKSAPPSFSSDAQCTLRLG